ncbi:cbb3-type cytochrome c oxidase subunit 3 [Jannaschia ovalis]|uniref:Cbb3-type cytochrome c oxidase subunit 3 n=1 Tax=Jannaschia ovalis TaxID=3038773 RepID=A0ABY8L9N1_9RHOB|nr:cbb3-type cytochrome c oxidase subunit 3 [Jannaschia sp. GRR-S6-38]WGH78068.1 cbb3-type cytochrome c oxidase subunit 3 [Jannaschia sp. GRR-S6-38]
METYTFLRQLADSWVLLALTLFFLGVIAWAFRPGSRPLHDDAAAAPFRHDELGCDRTCADCNCAAPDFTKGPSHG